MGKSKEERINDLVTTLSRIRDQMPHEYPARLAHYVDMRAGGDGGPWREGATSALRELHYTDFLDEDFQTVLELLDETPIMPESERAERFSHERGLWKRIKKSLGN